MGEYEGAHTATVDALAMPAEAVVAQAKCPLTIHADARQLRQAMADRFFSDITATLARQGRCTLIVPVGPVGQYELLAERCTLEGVSLADVTLIVMDEYLRVDGRWIPADDPLSFRGHMQRNLLERIPAAARPRLVVPDPLALDEIPRVMAERGLDLAYAGVGITGHMAFNDPVPGREDAQWFASLPTRIVQLSAETRLINSVTAARGNVLRIPFMAVTVGMKEILSARTLRIWMNREWQSAAIRRMLFGPVTASFPASLMQMHPDVTIDATEEVLALPEPGLR